MTILLGMALAVLVYEALKWTRRRDPKWLRQLAAEMWFRAIYIEEMAKKAAELESARKRSELEFYRTMRDWPMIPGDEREFPDIAEKVEMARVPGEVAS